jgi:hypothetical protein
MAATLGRGSVGGTGDEEPETSWLPPQVVRQIKNIRTIYPRNFTSGGCLLRIDSEMTILRLRKRRHSASGGFRVDCESESVQSVASFLARLPSRSILSFLLPAPLLVANLLFLAHPQSYKQAYVMPPRTAAAPDR